MSELFGELSSGELFGELFGDLGSGELFGHRWFSSVLPISVDSELDSESESEAEVESSTTITDFRSGDLVLFLNCLDDKLTREQETQQLLFIAISLICYRRELFPRRSFKNVYMPSLGMKFPQLVLDEEDGIALFSFISCLRGVNAALKKNYLKGFWLRLFDAEGTVEEYCFGFSCKEEQRVAERTTQASFQACASMMIRMLEQLLVGLQKLPSELSLFTCLLLNDTAPNDYKPFSGWGMDEEPHAFLKENLGMERPEGTSIVIDNRGHVKVTLKVRTVLDQSSSEDDESTGSSEDDETIGSPRVGFGDATEDN